MERYFKFNRFPVFLLFFLTFITMSLSLFAQTEVPPVDPESSVGEFIRENMGMAISVALFLLEIIVRLIPGDKDRSILNLIKFIVDKVFPNRATDGGKLGFLPPSDATTKNVTLLDKSSKKQIDPGSGKVIS